MENKAILRPGGSTYIVAALACGLIALTGFARSYSLKSLFGNPPLPVLLHVHGVIMSSWCVLFIVQTYLVATHRVRFEITEPTRKSVLAWIRHGALKTEDYLFPSRLRLSPHLSTRQYARIVEAWVTEIGLDAGAYGTHTMRRTKASLIYRRTKNLRAVRSAAWSFKIGKHSEVPRDRGR
jgi:hypothetical protein